MNVRVLLYVQLFIVALHAAMVALWLVTGVRVFEVVASLLATLEPVLTTVLLFALSRHSPSFKKAWRTGGFSFLFFIVGVGAVAVLLFQGEAISPSFADPFLVVAGSLFLLMTLRLPRPDTVQLRGLRLFVNVAVSILVFVTYIWRFAFAPQLVAQQTPPFTIALQTFYLLLNFGAFGVLITLYFWTKFSRQLALLMSGMACFVTGNLFFALFGPYPELSHHMDWVALVLALGYVLFCWGAYTTTMTPYGLEDISPMSAVARLINRSPYSGIVTCYALILAPPPKDQLVSLGVILGIVLLTVLVLFRQFLYIADNEKLALELQTLSGQLEARVSERGRQLEDSQSRLLASEKLASLGRLTAGLAHEINTPLAAAMHNLYHAKELTLEYKNSLELPSVTKEDHKEIARELNTNLDAAQTSLERLGEFVRRMRSQTRLSSGEVTFYPAQLVRDVLAVLQPKAKELGVTLGFFEPGEVVSLHGDPSRFSQVVSNLLTNALDACKGKTNAFVSVRLMLAKGEVLLEVQDNGVGIPAELQQKIFEPMFTTKDIGQGTGLGLTVVYDIVHGSFQGEIEVQSEVGQGSSFTVRFPQTTVQSTLVEA